MKKTIFGCLGAAAVAFTLLAPANVHAQGLFGFGGLGSICTPCGEVECNPCDDAQCDPCDAVCGTKAGKWFLNGHLDAGFFANGHGQKSSYEGNALEPFDGIRGADNFSGNTLLLQNTRLTGAQINQVYVSMGKSVDGKRGLDIGGTVDFTWGSDAYIAQSAGMETETGRLSGGWGTGDYYAAFAQAYAELEYKRWNVKVGKFYAPFGVGGYKSTDNFFYTWDPNKMIAPTTAGGAYATYTVNDKLSVIGGWAQPDQIGKTGDDNAFLGGFIWDATKRLNLAYTFGAGQNTNGPYVGQTFQTNPVTADMGAKAQYFVHSFVATTQINKRLKYVLDWTYNQERAIYQGDVVAGAYTYGLNNEIIYQYNKKWSFGTRFGMLGGNVPYTIDLGGLDDHAEKLKWYNVSLGANWTPTKWLVVKPELRYDWVDDSTVGQLGFPFGAVKGYPNGNSYQFSGGLSTVVKF